MEYRLVLLILVLSYSYIAMDSMRSSTQLGLGLIFFVLGTAVLLWK